MVITGDEYDLLLSIIRETNLFRQKEPIYICPNVQCTLEVLTHNTHNKHCRLCDTGLTFFCAHCLVFTVASGGSRHRDTTKHQQNTGVVQPLKFRKPYEGIRSSKQRTKKRIMRQAKWMEGIRSLPATKPMIHDKSEVPKPIIVPTSNPHVKISVVPTVDFPLAVCTTTTSSIQLTDEFNVGNNPIGTLSEDDMDFFSKN